MIILGIETSCDETGIAVVRGNKKKLTILSNIVASQIEVHKKWGGVMPLLAKREHQKNLVPVLLKSLKQAGLYKKILSQNQSAGFKKKLADILTREPLLLPRVSRFLASCKIPEIDGIAVTNRPGLEPALWAGINFAKTLAFAWKKPLVGIDHLEGHLLMAHPFPRNPALSLVVSGGHTALILSKPRTTTSCIRGKRQGAYAIIGETRDDAAGEMLDKCSRLLGLGYPGGPAVAAEAAKLEIRNSKLEIRLPRPMMHSHDYDFSFSGLKTAVLYDYRSRKVAVRKGRAYIRAMCCELQQALCDVLVAKTLAAAREYKVKSLLLGGGVSANTEFRKQIAVRAKTQVPGVSLFMPTPEFCTDNGVMAAFAGYIHYRGVNLTRLRKPASRRIIASSHTFTPRP